MWCLVNWRDENRVRRNGTALSIALPLQRQLETQPQQTLRNTFAQIVRLPARTAKLEGAADIDKRLALHRSRKELKEFELSVGQLRFD